MKNKYCVIMCGGVGSRFWPYSRENRPKQFIDFLGTGRSLLQMCCDRLEGLIPAENIVIVTSHLYKDLIKEQLPNIKAANILYEPARRNTAPCIAWAAYHIQATDPDAQILVCPSDHLILKPDVFRESVLHGFEFLEQHDALLTFGLKPNRPETGYGYIQVGETAQGDIRKVKTFTEKPNLELAKIFVQSGEFYWNSGMFLFNVGTIIAALHQHAPLISEQFENGISTFATEKEQDFVNSNFELCPSVSIDYAVMEKADNVFVQCVDFGWSDLGTWGSLYENSPKNIDGNVKQNCNAHMINSFNNVVAVRPGKLIVTSGLNNYIVADTDDVLLIVPRDEEQKIKLYVNEIKSLYGDKYL
ncbi:MAG: NTP transferase domain-containing protein [Muribaculaceae bacterium]|nr:NTP transferase domain-containing protein [Muribaculaceae bacterium]